MKIVIAGGTGFVGSALAEKLAQRHEVVVLSRRPSGVPVGRSVPWGDDGVNEWKEEVGTADAVVNLAGENVGNGRWTASRKRALVESRISATNRLVDAIRDAQRPGISLINASAIGYYGARGDERLDEEAAAGEGFLVELARDWEKAAREAEGFARVVILRIGVVIDREGGALGKMLLPFRMGAGGPLGSGRQWMSWIDLTDLVRFIEWAIDEPAVRGVYNATAPNAVTNKEFTKALGRALHRPAILPAPSFALRLALGEMAEEMLLSGQRVEPVRAIREGFHFDYESIEASFARALAG